MMTEKKEKNILEKKVTWRYFMKELSSRLILFTSQPITVIYLLIIVGIVGSTGVWLPLVIADCSDSCFNYRSTLTVGLSTYCIAISSTTIADQVLSKDVPIKTIQFFNISLFSLALILAFVTLINNSIISGISTTILAYILWMITYANDPAKQDMTSMEPDPYNSIGAELSDSADNNIQNAFGESFD